MFRFASACMIAASLAAIPALAGEFNKKLSIGDAAPNFAGLEGVDGKMHALADLKGKDVIVICITCNHCPVAEGYEDRIIDFVKKNCSAADSKIGFVAISVNNLDEDKLPKMKERAKAKGFTFPYIHDPSQKVGINYGASVTPEFFVLNKDRKVVYMGAMDDNQNANKAKTNYLEAAVKAALDGKTPDKAETRPVGCSVKYDTK